jgi:DNA-directed RNA polymerase II subunit RPB2
MSMFALSHLIRADTIVHVLNSPQKPLVSTKAAAMMGFNNMPAGVNAVVAIACYTGLISVRPLSRRKTFGKFTSQ